MATLPTAAQLTATNVTKEQQRTALEQQRQYLSDTLGTSGTAAGAVAVLGAASAFGAVGTYVFAYRTVAGTLAAGAQVPGSQLTPAAIQANVDPVTTGNIPSNNTGSGATNGSTLTGTWVFMGGAGAINPAAYAGGLFLRVA